MAFVLLFCALALSAHSIHRRSRTRGCRVRRIPSEFAAWLAIGLLLSGAVGLAWGLWAGLAAFLPALVLTSLAVSAGVHLLWHFADRRRQAPA